MPYELRLNLGLIARGSAGAIERFAAALEALLRDYPEIRVLVRDVQDKELWLVRGKPADAGRPSP